MSILNTLLGGSGFKYESGSFTPTASTQSRTVNFAKTYTKPPTAIICFDATNTSVDARYNGLSNWVFLDAKQILSQSFYWSSTAYKGLTLITYNNGSYPANYGTGLKYGSEDATQTGTNATRHYAREASATLEVANCYFLENREYAWVAIWFPDSWTPPT